MSVTTVSQRVRHILAELPPQVTLVAAAKGASPEQLREAIEAGIRVIGHNRISEARATYSTSNIPVEWHYIGTLSRHAVRASTLRMFDLIQTVDSLELASAIDTVCGRNNLRMPILVEVNSGREPQKAGIMPENVEPMVKEMARLEHIELMGLMTMGPASQCAAVYRPCFAKTYRLFQHLRSLNQPDIRMQHLSMGMSDSYQVAIEEGATMVRLGTALFGGR